MYKRTLDKIANTIFINTQHLDGFGLLNGQIGVIIFLYNYADYTDKPGYAKLADKLVEYVYKDVKSSVGTDFFDGLAGIAYGIDYIVKNKFVDTDGDILNKMDFYLGKMDKNAFISELESDLPLFSKGLYFLQRREKYSLSRIVEECSLFLDSQKENIPLSYINSIYYFVNRASLLNEIEVQSLNKIFHILERHVSEMLSKHIYNESDLYVLNRNIQYLEELQVKERWLNLISNYHYDEPSLFHKAWTNFLYKYDDQIIVDRFNIHEQLKDIEQNLVSERITLHDGLAGLGLELIRVSKLK